MVIPCELLFATDTFYSSATFDSGVIEASNFNAQNPDFILQYSLEMAGYIGDPSDDSIGHILLYPRDNTPPVFLENPVNSNELCNSLADSAVKYLPSETVQVKLAQCQDPNAPSRMGFIAHPFDTRIECPHTYATWPTGLSNWDAALISGYAGLEIWSDLDGDYKISDLNAWLHWQQLLTTISQAQGGQLPDRPLFPNKFPVGIGNSDAHEEDNVGNVFTYAWFPTNSTPSASDIGQALLNGHCVASNGPLVFATLQNAKIGEVAVLNSLNDFLHVQIRSTEEFGPLNGAAPLNYRLSISRDGTVLPPLDLPAPSPGGNPYSIALDISLSDIGVTAESRFILLSLFRGDGEYQAFTNPIWLQAPSSSAPPAGMVLVPSGPFKMGDPFNEGDADELPVHDVSLSSYYIDKFEVTNQQYADALNWARAQNQISVTSGGVVVKPGTSIGYCDTTTSSPYSRIVWNQSTQTFSVTPTKANHPMVMVSWYGAVAYCNWRSAMDGRQLCFDLSPLNPTWICDFTKNGYRPPTEAEWEKAAAWDPALQRKFRFGEHSDGCGYNCLDGHRANYLSSGDPFETGAEPRTTPVGYYDGTTHGSYATQDARSYYGCYDMSGNVWEWCYDWYGSYPSTPQNNPAGPASGTGRLPRGGSWLASVGANLRAADRPSLTPDYRLHHGGFRCAASAPSDMVQIPAGTFQMGDSFGEGGADELPLHSVFLSSYHLDRFEVTNQQFAGALNWAKSQNNLITVTNGVVYKLNSGTSFPYCSTTSASSAFPFSGDKSRIIYDAGTGLFSVVAGKENHPMTLVTWYGAAAYCNWRSTMEGRVPCYNLSDWTCSFSAGGYRLPTEAEWEKAARGGQANLRFPWGDSITGSDANYLGSGDLFESDTIPKTTPVGYYNGQQLPAGPDRANGYGLYDMSGNVWEWCNDWYGSSYPSASQTNPPGPTAGATRVFRGGAWDRPATSPSDLRCANRNFDPPGQLHYVFGLRSVLPSPFIDSDGDGVADDIDNCPTTPNPTQSNCDQDAMGDACDTDSSPACPSANLIRNGEFGCSADGWALINHGNANWRNSAGWNDEPGWFFVNDVSGPIPETSQLVSGLNPGAQYTVSGFYRRDTQNHPNPNFSVLVDSTVYFTAGGSVEQGWTYFSFSFLAANNQVLLRFRTQLSGDDAYGIDNIRVFRDEDEDGVPDGCEASYDSDADGVSNLLDVCPGTPLGDPVNAQGCSCSQLNCDDSNSCTLDTCIAQTAQCIHTPLTGDADGDGVADCADDCPNTPVGQQHVDANGCSCSQASQLPSPPDGDNDGVIDACDNCPAVSNPGQADCDNNGVGDACEPNAADCNSSGVPDSCEPPMAISTFIDVLLGIDLDPVNQCFADVNRDGIADGLDVQPYVLRLIGG